MSVTVIKQIAREVDFAGNTRDSYFAAAYNNNYFEWTGTGAGIKDGEIWFNGTVKFTKLQGIGGNFKFNVIEYIKSLFGYFDDTSVYQYSDVVVFESNLSKVVSVKLVVNYDDDSSDEIDLTAYFIPAVRQHWDYLKTSMYLYESDYLLATPMSGSEFCRALMPTGVAKNLFSQRLRIYKGYPQDITIITKPLHDNLQFTLFPITGSALGYENRTITVADGDRTNKWAQRVILSDGVDTLAILSTYPQTKGRMQIGSSADSGTGPTSIFTFTYEIIDECGTYVKWRNAAGGWSYWLFNKNTRSLIDAKSRGTVNINDGDLSFNSDEENLGVDATEKVQFMAQNLDKTDYDYLIDLSTSPCVYLYMEPKGTKMNAYSWLKLPQISNFKYSKKPESQRYSIGFEFSVPKTFTQTL